MNDNTVDLVLCFLGLGFTGLWVAACICYAHCRGDAEIGVADTQGRTNSEDATTRSGTCSNDAALWPCRDCGAATFDAAVRCCQSTWSCAADSQIVRMNRAARTINAQLKDAGITIPFSPGAAGPETANDRRPSAGATRKGARTRTGAPGNPSTK